MPLDIAKNKLVRKVLTDLNEAAYKCDVHNLKFLVNCGNKINQKISIFGEAPIHQTIKSDKKENVEALEVKTPIKHPNCKKKAIIECGGDINLLDSNGWSGLHHAAQKV
jgi:ankyrin repeat protein